MLAVISLATVAAALAIAAASCSIIGLRAFAAGAADGVTVLAGILEIAKLVTAAWLHSAWPATSRPMRCLGIAFVAAIMILTTLGVGTFLVDAHTIQVSRHEVRNLRRQQVEEAIALRRATLGSARREMDAMLDEHQALAAAGHISRSRIMRIGDQQVIAELRRHVADEQGAIEALQTELVAAGSTEGGAMVGLGAARTLGKMLNIGDNAAVNILISLLAVTVDPLAIWLSVAASQSYGRRKSNCGRADANILEFPISDAGAANGGQTPDGVLPDLSGTATPPRFGDQKPIAPPLPAKRGRGRPPGSRNKPKPPFRGPAAEIPPK